MFVNKKLTWSELFTYTILVLTFCKYCCGQIQKTQTELRLLAGDNCSLNKCKTCLNSKNCKICELGYYIDTYTNSNDYEQDRCYECSDSINHQSCKKPSNCDKFIDFICQSCESGYRLNEGKCEECEVQNCLKCDDDVNKCQQCSVGLGMSQNKGECVQCIQFCNECTMHNSCTVCSQGYELRANNTCVFCNFPSNPHCEVCDQNRNTCWVCADGYYGAHCQLCQQPQCNSFGCPEHCDRCDDSHSCNKCTSGYGISQWDNTQCVKCQDAFCKLCSLNSSQCTECTQGYGVRYFNFTCNACQDQNCQYCGEHFTQCQKCQPRFGFDNSRVCQNCSEYCLECYDNYKECTKCQVPKLLNSTSKTCGDCHISCYQCQENDTNICTECYQANFINVTLTCQRCLENCFNCTHKTTCNQCYDIFFKISNASISTTDLCLLCPVFCETCILNNNKIKCSSCIEGFISAELTTSKSYKNETYGVNIERENQCLEICGDQISFLFQCDLQIGIDFNGCDDECNIEEDFVCNTFQNPQYDWEFIWKESSGQNISGNFTICSYTKQIQITKLNLTKEHFSNIFTLTLKIYPPLHVLKTASKDELLQLFIFEDQQIIVKNIFIQHSIGNSNNNHFYKVGSDSDSQNDFLVLTIEAELFTNFIDREPIISFVPDKLINPQYFSTPQTQLNLNGTVLPYYKPFVFTFSQFSNIFILVLVILGWIQGLLGLIIKRLAGLQTIIAIQMCFFTIFWLNTYLYLPFEETSNLKYSTGFMINFFQSQKSIVFESKINAKTQEFYISSETPHFYFFSQASFINGSVNILTLLQMAMIVVFAISFFVFRLYCFCLEKKLQKMRNTKLMTEKQEQDLDNLIKQKILFSKMLYADIRRFSFQIFLFLCFANVSNLINESIIYFKYFLKPVEVSELAIFSVMVVLDIITLFAFYKFYHIFEYFRSSFQKNKISLNHYWFYFVIIVSTSILQGLINEKYCWAVVIPFVLFFMYTAVRRPYREKWDNLRALVTLLSVMVSLGMNIFVVHFQKKQKNSAYIHFYLIGAICLVFVCTLINIAFMIYSQISRRRRMNKNNKDNCEVMMELETLEVQSRVPNILKTNDSVLKQILTPRVSLLELSNCIVQIKNEQLLGESDLNKFQNLKSNYKNFHKIRQFEAKDDKDDLSNSLLSYKNGKQQILQTDRTGIGLRQQQLGKTLRKQMNKQKVIKNNADNSESNVYENGLLEKDHPEAIIQQKRIPYIDFSDISEIKNNHPSSAAKKLALDSLDEYMRNEENEKYSNDTKNMTKQQISKLNKRNFALNLVMNENEFIRFKNVQNYVKKQDNTHIRLHQQNFIESYDNIQ